MRYSFSVQTSAMPGDSTVGEKESRIVMQRNIEVCFQKSVIVVTFGNSNTVQSVTLVLSNFLVSFQLECNCSSNKVTLIFDRTTGIFP